MPTTCPYCGRPLNIVDIDIEEITKDYITINHDVIDCHKLTVYKRIV